MDFVICDPELQKIRDEIYNSIYIEYKREMLKILERTDEMPSYALDVSFGTLNFLCPKTMDVLLSSPEEVFLEADKVTMKVLTELFELEKKNNPALTLKENVHYRLRSNSFPCRSPIYRHNFPDCSEIRVYMVLVGTVTTVKPAEFLVFQRSYQCSACKTEVKIPGKATRYYVYPNVIKTECTNCCTKNATLKLVKQTASQGQPEKPDFTDYQEIKIQENVKGGNFGVHSQAYVVALEEDLVNSCKPGDNVCIGGWLFIRHKKFKKDTKMELQAVFKANHVTVTNEDQRAFVPTLEQKNDFRSFWKAHEKNPFLGRDCIVKSFGFELCNMYPVKLGLLVALIGGVEKFEEETKVRGLSHVLLVGDPGTGKSQMLQYCEKLIPRSVYTTGAGSSAAGLTVGAVKVGEIWDLQAGALLLADSGICCIDEFSLLGKRESASIHEAMEQQTISVAKAGIVCKLKTRCTVIAASNPKKMMKQGNIYQVDIGMSSPLLSRFDLVMLLADEHNPEFDELFCDFVLGLNQCKVKETPLWDTDTLRAYIGYVKKFTVSIDDEVSEVLSAYYLHQREFHRESDPRVSVRLLESLIRISEGHARLMFRRQVLVSDAVMAITLMEYSLLSTGLLRLETNSVTHVPFPENPMETYRHNARRILLTLGLNKIWDKELQWLCMLPMNNFNYSSSRSSQSVSVTSLSHESESNENAAASQDQYDWFHVESSKSAEPSSSSASVNVIPASFPFDSSDTDMSGIEPKDNM